MDDAEPTGERTVADTLPSPIAGADSVPPAGALEATIGLQADGSPIGLVPTIARGAGSGRPPATWGLPSIPGYSIEAEVGRGGMGVVYRARQSRLNRTVALKMILAGAHAGAEAGARFLAEAEAIARLQHPNIVQIFHIDEHEGRPFFEMEYVGGGTLADHIDGQPLPPREAARLVARLARAVAEAHRAGIVHRDLKPNNVLMAEDGTPKVADFGLAKSIGVESGLTQTDSILGSPSYMAPEQAEGKAREVGPSADVYALGAILYEQLTGRAPFVGASVLETLRQVREAEPVPPSRLVPGLSRDAETIALKCLEKAPSRRYATASDLAADLERFLEGSPILARPVAFWERGWKWAARRPAIAGLALALLATAALLLGLGAVSYLRVQEALGVARDERARAVVAWGEEASARERAEADFARAEAARDEAMAETYRASISEARALRAAHLPGWRVAALGNLARLVTLPTPRRDLVELRSEAVACLGEFDIREVARFRAPRGEAFGLDFLADGRTLASAHRVGGVQLWDVAGRKHAGTIPDAGGNPGPIWGWPERGGPWPSVRRRPDGRGLAYNTPGHGVASVEVARMRPDRPPIDRPGVNSSGLSFDEAGRRLAVGWGDGRVDVLDAVTGSSTLSDSSADPRAFALSPDGLRLALTGADNSIRLRLVDGDGAPVVLGRHRGPIRVVAFSPDGSTLATGSDDHGVMLWDVARGEPRFPLLGHKQRVETLAYSADGEWLATGGADHTVRLWEARTGRELAVLEHPSFVVAAAFSPDGQYLATSCAYDPMIRLYRIEGRGERKKLTGHTTGLERLAYHPRLDRLASGEVDGRLILRDPGSGRTLRNWVGHRSHVNSLAFSPDGRLLASGGGGPDSVVRLWDVESGTPRRTLPSRGSSVVTLAFDGAGRRVATGDFDGVVRLWDAEGGALLRESKLPSHASAVAFVDHDRRLLAQVFGGATWLLDVTGDEPLRSFASPGGGLILMVDAGRSRAIVGGAGGDLTAVSLPGLAPGRRAGGVHQGLVLILALSPDGTLIASGGRRPPGGPLRRGDPRAPRPVPAPDRPGQDPGLRRDRVPARGGRDRLGGDDLGPRLGPRRIGRRRARVGRPGREPGRHASGRGRLGGGPGDPRRRPRRLGTRQGRRAAPIGHPVLPGGPAGRGDRRPPGGRRPIPADRPGQPRRAPGRRPAGQRPRLALRRP